ncbi:putative immunoglobulin-blocking virulence protein [Mycoplasma corogypsi]|uniref:putative immunoglobulin-blocking virulence protein n=1 Tax=Mycoplasma corogypsi TaxID=2106 RepID=UPI0038734138
MLNKAKKKKILKSTAIASATTLGLSLPIALVFQSFNKSSNEVGVGNISRIQRLNHEIIEASPDASSSISDDLLKEVTTTIIFQTPDGKTFPEVKIKSRRLDTLKINLRKYIPEGYVLDPNKYPDRDNFDASKLILLGKVNTIFIIEADQLKQTFVEFKLRNTTIIPPIALTVEDQKLTIVEIAKKYLPHYQRYDMEALVGTMLNIGQNNVINLTLLAKKLTTQLRYILNDNTEQPFRIETIEEFEDVKINANEFLPKGYIFSSGQGLQFNALDPGKTYDLKIEKSTKEPDNKIRTTINFVFNAKIVNAQTIESEPGTQTVNIMDIIPKNYTLDDKLNASQNLNLTALPTGKTYNIFVTRNSDAERINTKFRFVFGTQVIDIKDVMTEVKTKVSAVPYVPEGYDIVNSNEYASLDSGGDYTIPVQKAQDKTLKLPDSIVARDVLTKEEVDKILNNAGNQEDPDSVFIETPSSLPDVPKSKVPDAVYKENKKRFNLFSKLISKSASEDYTVEDFKEIFKEQYNTNKDWLGSFVQYLNGVDVFPYDVPNKPNREQLRQILKAQIEVAMSMYDSETAKGNVPDFHVSANTWGFNLGINYGPQSDEENSTLVSIKRANERRAFANNTYYNRTSDKLLSGEYTGWSRTDATDNYIKYGLVPISDRNKMVLDKDFKNVPKDDKIRVWTYKPNADNDAVADKNKTFKVLDVDFTGTDSIEHYFDFLKKYKGNDIFGVYFKNILTSENDRTFYNMLKMMPKSVKKVTLDFASEKMFGIIALKDRELIEVDLITSLNNTNDNIGDLSVPGTDTNSYGWGIDPIAFNKTKAIAYDYIPVKSWESINVWNTVRSAGAIQFNVIRPDIGATDSDIKEGFKLALNKHSDWRVYNGNYGDGSYPVKIDLSNIPTRTSLIGIDLNDRYKKQKRFKTLKLYADSDTFTVPLLQFDKQQWEAMLANFGPRPEDKPKIIFSNRSVTKVYIKGDGKNLIGQKGYKNQFAGLFYGLSNARRVTDILVDSQEVIDLIKVSGSDSYLGNMTLRVVTPEEKAELEAHNQ